MLLNSAKQVTSPNEKRAWAKKSASASLKKTQPNLAHNDGPYLDPSIARRRLIRVHLDSCPTGLDNVVATMGKR